MHVYTSCSFSPSVIPNPPILIPILRTTLLDKYYIHPPTSAGRFHLSTSVLLRIEHVGPPDPSHLPLHHSSFLSPHSIDLQTEISHQHNAPTAHTCGVKSLTHICLGCKVVGRPVPHLGRLYLIASQSLLLDMAFYRRCNIGIRGCKLYVSKMSDGSTVDFTKGRTICRHWTDVGSQRLAPSLKLLDLISHCLFDIGLFVLR